MKIKKLFGTMMVLFAALGLFVSCSHNVSSTSSTSGTTDEELTSSELTVSTTAEVSATTAVIKATVTSSEDGELTYQWFNVLDDGSLTIIYGATSATLSLSDLETGTTYTYCVKVTETVDGTVTSIVYSKIVIQILDSSNIVVNAEAPVLANELSSASYYVGDTADALDASATVIDGGVITYQWYVDDEEISGATSATYKPSTETAGTFTYKVIVTNTNSSSEINGSATSETSATATIKVSSASSDGTGSIYIDFN